MKKALNVLPKLLLRMHLVAKSHINSINLDTMNQSDLWNFLNLVGVDKDFKTITTPEEVPSKVEMIYSKMKTNPLSDDDAEEIVNYFLSKSKIEKILENDRAYKKIIKEIDGMSSLIPSEDIALKVNEFKKDSDRAYYLYIVNQMPPDLMSKIFSPKIEAKFITINKNIDGEIMKSLARVRESIDRYYRRDKLNDTAKS
jgi:competence protein ComGF